MKRDKKRLSEQLQLEQQLITLMSEAEQAHAQGRETDGHTLNARAAQLIGELRDRCLIPLTPELLVEHCSDVLCLTPEEYRAGEIVTRRVSFTPEDLKAATDQELLSRVVFWMRPMLYHLPEWTALDHSVRRTGELDEQGNEYVEVRFRPGLPGLSA